MLADERGRENDYCVTLDEAARRLGLADMVVAKHIEERAIRRLWRDRGMLMEVMAGKRKRANARGGFDVRTK